MKKIYLILVSLIFILALSACGGFEERYPEEQEGTYTKEEVDQIVSDKVAGVREEMYEGQIQSADMQDILLAYTLMLNDKMVIKENTAPEYYDMNIDRLREAYGEYLVEQHPDYFTEEDFANMENEVYEKSDGGKSVRVEYLLYSEVIVIEKVTLCGDTCEIVDWDQTNFVITEDRLERMFNNYLDLQLD